MSQTTMTVRKLGDWNDKEAMPLDSWQFVEIKHGHRRIAVEIRRGDKPDDPPALAIHGDGRLTIRPTAANWIEIEL
jgi:hypothetical protein